MSVKKGLSATFQANPLDSMKDTARVASRDFKHKAPKVDTTAQDAALQQQKLDQADLDAEENRRRKGLLSAATGIRAFRGSPLFRAAPGNSAGAAGFAAGAAGGAGGGGGSAVAALRANAATRAGARRGLIE